MKVKNETQKLDQLVHTVRTYVTISHFRLQVTLSFHDDVALLLLLVKHERQHESDEKLIDRSDESTSKLLDGFSFVPATIIYHRRCIK